MECEFNLISTLKSQLFGESEEKHYSHNYCNLFKFIFDIVIESISVIGLLTAS